MASEEIFYTFSQIFSNCLFLNIFQYLNQRQGRCNVSKEFFGFVLGDAEGLCYSPKGKRALVPLWVWLSKSSIDVSWFGL